MYSKALDLFINKKAHNNPDLLFRFRFLVTLIFAFIIFDLTVAVLNYSTILQDEFNYKLYTSALLGIMVTIKLSSNIQLASFFFILFSLGLNIAVVDLTGGIYSYNMKWLTLILLFAIIFNYKPNSKAPFIYLLIVLAINIYFFVVESDASRNDFNNLLKFKKTDYLIENVMHLLVFTTIVYFYYLSHNFLLKEVNKKNKVLKHQYKLNVIKTKEIKANKIELEEKNRDLKSYAFVTSHDLKEPLRTITNFTQLLKIELSEVELSKDALTYLNFVEAGGKRMFNLVEDALILSKVDNIKTDSFKQLNLNQIIKEVLIDLSNQIKHSKAHIQYKNLPVINGNRIEVKRLFQNLISNSIKFAKKDVPPLIDITHNFTKSDTVFSITDNGIGIDEANLKTIFQPYKRLDKAFEGTGLGLAICKKIVEIHGGKIWVAANEKAGITFNFTMPAV